jgi:glucokinase
MDLEIVADVGGTQIRVAAFQDGADAPVEIRKIRTKDKEKRPEERLADLIRSMLPREGRLRAVAVAVPGYVDPVHGLVYRAPNIPGWDNFPVREYLEEKIGAPVLVGNDANLAALGEWRYGAGVGYHNLIYLTISTGIGAGVIMNDRLILGEHGLAAELGHVTVVPEGPLCGCGQRGHLEAVASGTAIARYVAEKIALGYPTRLAALPSPTAKDVSAAAEQGDELAIRALHHAGTYIGYALADFLHMLNPAIVILGGGVSRAGAALIEPLKAALPERIMNRAYLENLVITTCALGDNAGLLGALVLARTVPDS